MFFPINQNEEETCFFTVTAWLFHGFMPRGHLAHHEFAKISTMEKNMRMSETHHLHINQIKRDLTVLSTMHGKLSTHLNKEPPQLHKPHTNLIQRPLQLNKLVHFNTHIQDLSDTLL